MSRRTLTSIPSAAVAAYLECALWASTDDGGAPLDGEYDTDDITRASEHDARIDIRDFLDLCADSGVDPLNHMSEERMGHDLWLTRNRHGAGFWDRGYPSEVSDVLCRAAHSLGGLDPYINRGRVHIRR